MILLLTKTKLRKKSPNGKGRTPLSRLHDDLLCTASRTQVA